MVNKAILIGNLGADPEIRYTQSGDAVASFNIATTEKWKDKDGNQQEKTEWHKIVAWGNWAELAGKYLQKGHKVYIEGKIEYRKWQDQSGNDKLSTEINVKFMTFLGGQTQA